MPDALQEAAKRKDITHADIERIIIRYQDGKLMGIVAEVQMGFMENGIFDSASNTQVQILAADLPDGIKDGFNTTRDRLIKHAVGMIR